VPAFVTGRVAKGVEPHGVSEMNREVGRLRIYRKIRYRPRRDEAIRFRLAVHWRWKAELLAIILVCESYPTVNDNAPGDWKRDASATNQRDNPIMLPASDLGLPSEQRLLKAW